MRKVIFDEKFLNGIRKCTNFSYIGLSSFYPEPNPMYLYFLTVIANYHKMT
jgi:hypothetical protein